MKPVKAVSFETANVRFETTNVRFETLNVRFETLNVRFETARRKLECKSQYYGSQSELAQLAHRKLSERTSKQTLELCNQRFHFEGNFLLKGFFWKMKEI